MPVQDHNKLSLDKPLGEPVQIHWLGGSGSRYSSTQLMVDDFVLDDGSIYILLKGESALWVGTARDLIYDQTSRSRFRSAIGKASIVLQLPAPGNELNRMWLIADLQTGRLDQSPAARNAA